MINVVYDLECIGKVFEINFIGNGFLKLLYSRCSFNGGN